MATPYYYTWTKQNGAANFDVKETFKDGYILPNNAKILDMTSTSYQAGFGHRPSPILDKINEQMNTLPMASPKANFDLKTKVSQRLIDKMKVKGGKLFYTVSGAESVENALKIARDITQRTTIACRKNSYHGASLGALSITGDWRNQASPTVDDWTLRIPDPYDDKDAAQAIETMEKYGPQKIAGLVLETITGNNGVWKPGQTWYQNLQSFCQTHGIIFILDEVICGFGRTGPDFGYLHFEGLTPDIICMAKGISGGIIPFGAIWTNESIANHYQENVLACGLTNYSHPLGLAALDGVLDIMDQDSFKKHKTFLEGIFAKKLNEFKQRAGVKEIRYEGLLAAIDFDKSFALPTWQNFLDAGIYLIVSPNRILLAPSMVMDTKNLEKGLLITDKTIWK